LFAPKILHNLCFPFLLGIKVVPKETEDNAYAKFWGSSKVYYGDVEMANYPFYFSPQGLSTELHPKRIIAGKYTNLINKIPLQLSLLKDIKYILQKLPLIRTY